MTRHHLTFFAFLLFTAFTTKAQISTPPGFLQKNSTNASRQWVDSVFATLTPDERIAQLIMVAAVSDTKRA